MFSIDQVAPIEGDIKEKIMHERMRYAKVYAAVEKYLSDVPDQIVIGGRIGVQLILERDRSTDAFMFHYELYAENAFKHANNLTNDIAKQLSPGGPWKHGQFIVWLKTYSSAPGSQSYGISVDNRSLVTIYGIPKGSLEIIKPVTVDSFDGKRKLAALPAEITLLNIYRDLYTPGKVDDWEEFLMSDENQLFQHLRDRETLIRKGTAGAAESDESGDTLDRKTRARIEMIIMQKYVVNNARVVLVGEHAMYIIMKDRAKINTSIIQICSTEDIETIMVDIEKLLKTEGIKNVSLTMKDQQLNIMKDHRLRRTVIRANDKEILYVYNSATYDLIPFNSITGNDVSAIAVGNPFVVLRFLLVEIWMVRWILSIGGIDENFARGRINSMLSRVLDLRKFMSEGSKSTSTITTISDSYFGKTAEQSGLKIFQMNSEDYLGEYVSEVISQKKSAPDQKRHQDYFPQRYYAEHKEYRVLSKS